ncbi:MAG TPA: DUF389 domain-containing protein [Thermoanaerobaculia bacterium]|nr:DUF389 domain-containing protein [Thermoanaerobaculia bacterium]
MATNDALSTASPAVSGKRTRRNWLADHIGLDDDQKLQVYRSIARSASMRDATYWAEILFSAGIATMGLTLGSPAVIIGAMLISPLMGPIMAAGLALAAGDFILTVRSIANIAVSSVIAISFATLLVVLLPFREMTSEIAARTQPNTLDLVVALFSGAVGALATSKSLRGVATSIPGVAIAVALMPPLCVTGYGLGVLLTVERAQGIGILRGGALLFVTNLIAMTFTSMLVFLALHVDAECVRTYIREWRRGDPGSAAIGRALDRLAVPKAMARIGSLPARLVLLVVLIAAVFVPLKRSFDALSREIAQRHELNAVQREASKVWQERFAAVASGDARSFIDVLEARRESDGRTALTMRVFTSRALSPRERTAYVNALAQSLRRKPETIALTLVEIPTSRYEIATRARPELAAPVEIPLAQQLETVSQRTAAALAATPLPSGATLLDAPVTTRAAGADVTLTYVAPAPLGADARSLIVRDVRSRLGVANARVSLRWTPQTTSVAFTGRSTTPSDIAQQQLVRLAQRLDEYPELLATVGAPDATARSAARAAVVVAILRAAGIPEVRVRTVVADPPREHGSVVTVVVMRATPGKVAPSRVIDQEN